MHAPIDPFTQRRVTETLKKAARLGLDPAEALHSEGLILTPLRDKTIRLQAMQYVILQVEKFRPAEFLRRKQNTSADIYLAIVEFLRELHAAEGKR